MAKWLQLDRVRKSTKSKDTDNQKKDLLFKMWTNRLDWNDEYKSDIIWNKESDSNIINSWKRKHDNKEKILWKSEIKNKIYNIFTELEYIFKNDRCVSINMLINFLRWTKEYDNLWSLKSQWWCLKEYSLEFIVKAIDEVIDKHWLHKVKKNYNGREIDCICSNETYKNFIS